MIFSWNGLHPTSESDGLTTKIKASGQINIYLRTNSPVVAENCNLCYPFSPDVRCASLYGVEFVFTKERREKKAQRRSGLKRLKRLAVHKKQFENLNKERNNSTPFFSEF